MWPLWLLSLGVLMGSGGGGSDELAADSEDPALVPNHYPDEAALLIYPDATDAPFVAVPVGRDVLLEGGGRIVGITSRALDTVPPHELTQSGGLQADHLLVRFGEPGRWRISTRAKVHGAKWPNNEIIRHWNIQVV
jgi:hypothetical protein